MTPQHLEQLIKQGEGLTLEFKLARETVTIPSFASIERAATPQVTMQETPQVTPQVGREQVILEFCSIPRSREEIQEKVGIKDREHFRSEILQPLLAQGVLVLTIPDKPNSRFQKYITKIDPVNPAPPRRPYGGKDDHT